MIGIFSVTVILARRMHFPMSIISLTLHYKMLFSEPVFCCSVNYFLDFPILSFDGSETSHLWINAASIIVT